MSEGQDYAKMCRKNADFAQEMVDGEIKWARTCRRWLFWSVWPVAALWTFFLGADLWRLRWTGMLFDVGLGAMSACFNWLTWTQNLGNSRLRKRHYAQAKLDWLKLAEQAEEL